MEVLKSKTALFIFAVVILLISIVAVVETLKSQNNEYIQMTIAFTYVMLVIAFIANTARKF